MKGFFLVILVCSGYLGLAQVPGYMGLKCTVNYDLGMLPPQVVFRSGTIPMLYHNVSVDYVLTRSISIGVKYGFMTYNAPAEINQIPTGSGYVAANYLGRYTQNTVAVLVKKFFTQRGYIAPIGRYVSFGAYFQHVVDKEATAFAGGNITNDEFTPPTAFRGVAEYGGVMFGIGRNFVVANRILIDFGGNFSLPLGYVIGQQDERETIYRDLVLRNLAQIYIGLGVLAF
jgi:hypothetical protein